MSNRAKCLRWAVLFLSLSALLTSAWIVQPGRVHAQAQAADFSVVAIMGDSLSQSYHDGVLHTDAQSHNYATLLSQQIGFELRQALIAEPGGDGSRFSAKDP